jgi:hypothetical protein
MRLPANCLLKAQAARLNETPRQRDHNCQNGDNQGNCGEEYLITDLEGLRHHDFSIQ